MELTLIVQGLDSNFAGSLYPIFRDLLQTACSRLKDLQQRCWNNVFQNVLSLKQRLERDKKTTDYKVNAN